MKCLVVRVCVSMTDVGVAATNLRVVCKTVTCISAFTEMAILEIVKKPEIKAAAGLDTALQATRRMPLWALAFALATGKNTRLFGVLDQKNQTRFSTNTCHSVQSARQPLSRRAISLGSKEFYDKDFEHARALSRRSSKEFYGKYFEHARALSRRSSKELYEKDREQSRAASRSSSKKDYAS